MKCKFINKIAVIHEKFIILFNLLRGPDITRSRSGPQAASCAFLMYKITVIILIVIIINLTFKHLNYFEVLEPTSPA